MCQNSSRPKKTQDNRYNRADENTEKIAACSRITIPARAGFPVIEKNRFRESGE
jgi:hypothetical protein